MLIVLKKHSEMNITLKSKEKFEELFSRSS